MLWQIHLEIVHMLDLCGIGVDGGVGGVGGGRRRHRHRHRHRHLRRCHACNSRSNEANGQLLSEK